MDSRYAFRPLWASLAVLLAVMPCAPTLAAPAAGENPPVLNEPVHLLHMVVPVTIAGNTYRFVLDTGASYTVIDKRLAPTLTRPATPDEIPSIFRTIMANGIGSTQGKLSADQVTLWRSLPITLGNYTPRAPTPGWRLIWTFSASRWGKRWMGRGGVPSAELGGGQPQPQANRLAPFSVADGVSAMPAL